MSAFSTFEFDDSPLTKESLADMPRAVRVVMTRGFTALGSLPESARLLLANVLKANIASVGDVDVPELATSLGVEESLAGSILSATSLLVALATSRTDVASVLIDELVREGLVQAESRGATLHVLEALVIDREQLRQSMRVERLASQTMPSFKSLWTSTDLRLEFKEGEVDLAVPTIIAHLRTDHSPSNCVFQLRKSDVRQLLEQFGKLMQELESAEKWSKGRG